MRAQEPVIPPADQPAEVDFLDVALLAARHLWLLILLPAAAGVVAFLASAAVAPPATVYTGTVKALIPASAAAPEVYAALARTEVVGSRLVRRFDLRRAYEADSEAEARQMLSSRTRILPGRVLSLSVDAPSARLAGDLANGYIEEVRELAHTLAISDAAQRRLIYQQHAERARQEAEAAKNRARSGTDAADAALARLRARITMEEIRLGALGTIDSELLMELARLRRHLDSLDRRATGNDRVDQSRREKPGAIGELEYLQAFAELIKTQYELARLNEGRTEIRVLEPASLDDVHASGNWARHNRALVVTVVVLAMFVLTLLALFLAEAWRRQHLRPGAAEKLALIRKALRLQR
jgi:hypothetical protein